MTGLAVLITGDNINLPTAPLRLLRIVRLARLVRVMRSQPELITIVRGLKRAFRGVLSAMIIGFVANYVCAIAIHEVLASEDEVVEMFFGSLPMIMWTLFMDGTLMDSVNRVASALRDSGDPT